MLEIPVFLQHQIPACYLVETRPHQVRVTRAFALLSVRLCKHSAKAHLMRTGLDKMTNHGDSVRVGGDLLKDGVLEVTRRRYHKG